MSTSPETPAQAEAEAETARAGLVNTLNQLRENLKPANVVDEVMTSAKVNASVITDQVWDTARKNPLPALMIGAGLAMIFGVGTRYAKTGDARGRSSTMPRRLDPDQDPDFGAVLAGDPVPVSRPSSLGSARVRVSNTVGAVTDRAGDLLDTANQRLSGAASRGKSAVTQAYSSAKRSNSMQWSRRNVGSSLSQLIEEQPLVLAAVGVAIGAAIGAALPHTQTEDSLMGETSGSVRTAAQGMVQDQIAQVKTAATHAVADIKQSVADHGVTADNLSGLVRDVGEKAKSATYEAGRGINPQT